MNRLGSAARSAVIGGRFLGVWSLLVTVPLSLTIMAPVGAGVDVGPGLPGTLPPTATCSATLALLAVGERRLSRARSRAAVIVVGIVTAAALRPVAQDAWAAALSLPSPDAAQLPFRMATNIIVWPVVLAVVAVLANTLGSLRRTNALLRDVADELAGARTRATEADRVARTAVQRAASALASALAATAAQTTAGADAAAVRTLGAEGFRTWSHRLQDLADDPALGAGTGASPAPRARGRSRRLPLRVPPRGTVTLVYVACTLPYALRTTSALTLTIGLLAVLTVGAAIDAVGRIRRIAARPGAAVAVFLLAAACGGALLSLIAVLTGGVDLIALLPAVDYFGFSLAGALCTGAVHVLRRDRRRLSSAVAGAQRAARDGTRTARDGLRRTAELLHRDGQGACVRFALEHASPSSDDVALLRRRLEEVIERMPATYDAGGVDAVALTGLVDTWGRVMDLQATVSPAAREALDRHPWTARDAYDVVAEGLLNAVKHGGGDRHADVDVALVPTGAGPRLRVRVRTRRPLPAGVELRPAARIRELGARLRSDGDGAVLEASLALAPAPVVSAEHPGERSVAGS